MVVVVAQGLSLWIYVKGCALIEKKKKNSIVSLEMAVAGQD